MHLVTVANMASAIQNGSLAGLKSVYVKSSKLILSILKALKKDGYIEDYDAASDRKYYARVYVKYDSHGVPVLRFIRLLSKPSRPTYADAGSFRTSEQFSTLIVSTSSLGVVSHLDARRAGIGGMVLLEVAA